MITYHYKCNKCEHEFEIEQRITDSKKKKCPECKKNSLERVLYAVSVVDMTPKTVGSFAEKKTRNMGHYERQEKQHEREQELKDRKKQGLEEIEQKLPKGMSVFK